MNFFEEASLRLKQQLKVTEDKQVAEAIGMTSNAWTMRKRRGNFPEKELYALAAKRPELGLDVGYVLNGVRASTPPLRAATNALQTGDAGALLQVLVDQRLTRLGLSSDQADAQFNLPTGTIGLILSGGVPTLQKTLQVCQALGIPFIGGGIEDEQEAQLLALWRALPSQAKEHLLGLLNVTTK